MDVDWTFEQAHDYAGALLVGRTVRLRAVRDDDTADLVRWRQTPSWASSRHRPSARCRRR